MRALRPGAAGGRRGRPRRSRRRSPSGIDRRHLPPDGGELRVPLAGHHQRRHRQLAQAAPQRHLRAGAGQAQAAGQPVGCVALRSARSAGSGGQPAEQRLAHPPFEERGDADRAAIWSARASSPSRAVRAPRRRRCPGWRRSAPAARTTVRIHQRGVQAQPAAEAVADVRRRCRRMAVSMSAVTPQVGPHVGASRRGRAGRRRRTRSRGGRTARRSASTSSTSG